MNGHARQGQLRIVPLDFKVACAFVSLWHRHLKPPQGGKFCIGVADERGILRGVAIVGRPVARSLQDGITLEVTRAATDGTPNVNSKLYAQAWQAAQALGYHRLITYNHTPVQGPTCGEPCRHWSCLSIRLGESGSSLKAAGWRVVHHRKPHSGWDRPSRPRDSVGSAGVARTLWEQSHA
ncbi:XF1762 family protein [Nonomuraea fuscirosea]|uniref:XF1762 family protein n=1 Tax=Nonomuraea fuscirosea TaxID=1291556 RepID=UPI00371622C7